MEPANTATADAIRRAQNAARTLRGRFVTARVAGDDEELASIAARALAACDELALAVPAVAERHLAWLCAVSRTLDDVRTGTLARCAMNHVERLALTARQAERLWHVEMSH